MFCMIHVVMVSPRSPANLLGTACRTHGRTLTWFLQAQETATASTAYRDGHGDNDAENVHKYG